MRRRAQVQSCQYDYDRPLSGRRLGPSAQIQRLIDAGKLEPLSRWECESLKAQGHEAMKPIPSPEPARGQIRAPAVAAVGKIFEKMAGADVFSGQPNK